VDVPVRKKKKKRHVQERQGFKGKKRVSSLNVQTRILKRGSKRTVAEGKARGIAVEEERSNPRSSSPHGFHSILQT